MSIEFTVYEKSTGRVLYGGTASDPSALITADVGVAEDRLYTEGYFLEGVHYTLPDQPSDHHVFDWVSKQWVDPRTLQELKDLKWSSIKTAREQSISTNLVTPYGVFDADTKARSNITDSIMLLQTLQSLGTPQTIDFTLADNTTVTLDNTAMVNVGLLLGQKVQLAHGQSRTLRALIDAATSAAELEGIVWTP